MKHRVLEAMSEALDLVRKSDLTKATAVIREALSAATQGAQASRQSVRRPEPPRL